MRVFGVILLVLARTAFRGLRSSAVTSSIAAITIAIALVLVGAFALVVGNMQGLLTRFDEELQVVAYLEPGLGEERQRALASQVATLTGVQSVKLVTKEQALERFGRSVSGSELLEGLELNPLPASLEIALLSADRTPQGIERLVGELEALAGVDELAHGQEWVEGYARAAALVRSGAWVIGAVLVVAALLIVTNTIRLAIYARKDEIEILGLVGAGRVFVRTPFLIEGTLQGVAGGVLAVLLLYATFRLLLPEVEYGLAFFLGSAGPRFFGTWEVAALVAGGGALGTIGSAAAFFGWRP